MCIYTLKKIYIYTYIYITCSISQCVLTDFVKFVTQFVNAYLFQLVCLSPVFI